MATVAITSRVGGARKYGCLQFTTMTLVITASLLRVSFGQGNCSPSGPFCQSGFCCSKFGFCGQTCDYCCPGNCQSQCPTPPGPGGVGNIVTSTLFNQIFSNRNPFYTYNAFIAAASFGSFSKFGTSGSADAQRREIAAFFAHISHETSGLAKINEDNPPPNFYCDTSQYPCVPGKQYYGRGPLQLSWNYNYAQAGNALGLDLLGNPDLVAQDATVAFETALWFWTTPQGPKPSCHDVIIGNWSPSSADVAAGRQPGFGLTIDIVNGGLECGPSAPNPAEAIDRVSLYQSICQTLGVSPGSNVDCRNMAPYGLFTDWENQMGIFREFFFRE